MAYRVAIECGNMRELWQGRERTIYLGKGAVCSQAHLSQVGGWGSVRSSPV